MEPLEDVRRYDAFAVVVIALMRQRFIDQLSEIRSTDASFSLPRQFYDLVSLSV